METFQLLMAAAVGTVALALAIEALKAVIACAIFFAFARRFYRHITKL